MTSSRFSAWAALASKPRLNANMRCFFKMLPFRGRRCGTAPVKMNQTQK
jgi:hypothetical protein